MSVPAVYTGVILIWATTPLAVQWSNDSLSPIAAVTYRMSLALLLTLMLCVLSGKTSLYLRRNWKAYAVASIGLFPNMPLVYTAAEYIPSGLIAIMFGLTPFVVALFSQWLLGESAMNRHRYAALAVAFAGVGMIYAEQGKVNTFAATGIGLMGISVMVFSLSSVLVKRFDNGLDPMLQISGSLLFAMPGLLASLVLMDGGPTLEISDRSLYAIIYLAVIGSVVGFVGYFYLLRALPATLVAMIPMVSPLLAVWLGVTMNNEPVGLNMVLGSGLVFCGLGLFACNRQEEMFNET